MRYFANRQSSKHAQKHHRLCHSSSGKRSWVGILSLHVILQARLHFKRLKCDTHSEGFLFWPLTFRSWLSTSSEETFMTLFDPNPVITPVKRKRLWPHFTRQAGWCTTNQLTFTLQRTRWNHKLHRLTKDLLHNTFNFPRFSSPACLLAFLVLVHDLKRGKEPVIFSVWLACLHRWRWGSGRMEEEKRGRARKREGWRAGVRMGAGTAEKSRCRRGQEENQTEKGPSWDAWD